MFARGDPRAAFHDLAFQIRGIGLELVNQLAIDEQRGMRGFRLVGPVAVEHQAEAVLGIHREAVDEVRGMARAQPRLVVVEEILGQGRAAARIVDADGGGVMHRGGLHSLRTEQGGPHRALGGIDVVFEQPGRQIQRVADVVETVGRHVRRKIVRGTNVDAQKIADGVVVFGSIEAVRRHTSGLGLGSRDPAGRIRTPASA